MLFGKIRMPTNSESLCRTCTSALVVTGYGRSQHRTMCTYVHPNVVMPFTVNTCSGYFNRNQPRKVMDGFKVGAHRNTSGKVTTHINVKS